MSGKWTRPISTTAPTATRASELETIEAMRKYGGAFVQALAEAAIRADSENLKTIKLAFYSIWAKYEQWGENDKRMRANAHDNG